MVLSALASSSDEFIIPAEVIKGIDKQDLLRAFEALINDNILRYNQNMAWQSPKARILRH